MKSVLLLVKQEANAFASISKVDMAEQVAYYRSYQHGRLTKCEQEPLEGFSVQLPLDVEPLTLLLREMLSERAIFPLFLRDGPLLGTA